MKSHGASGSVAMVWAICPAKSSSVLLGPIVGATTSPVATSKLAIKHCVPWRRYAYSGRSTRPGCIGQGGAARSRACIPGFLTDTEDVASARATVGRRLIRFTHGSHLGGKGHGVIRLGVEPGLDPM